MVGFVRNIIPFSAVDGPGNRTVIFLQGCNLNCWYCHNPETIQIFENEGDGVKALEVSALVKEVKKYQDFISGVTISGGECSVQSTFLIELCKALKAEGIHILIDTNGLMSEMTLEQLESCVDGFMFDVKAEDEVVHKALTGASNTVIQRNMLKIAQREKLYEIRTVIYAQMQSPEKTIDFVSRFITEWSPQTRYKLIQYRAHGVRSEFIEQLGEVSRSEMAKLFKRAMDRGVKTVILI